MRGALDAVEEAEYASNVDSDEDSLQAGEADSGISGEDLLENMERDYQPDPERDHYEVDPEAEYDEEALEQMDAAARRLADAAVDRRLRQEHRERARRRAGRTRSRLVEMLWADSAESGSDAHSLATGASDAFGTNDGRLPPALSSSPPRGRRSQALPTSSPISTSIMLADGLSSTADPLDEGAEDNAFQLEDHGGDIRLWLSQERPQRALQRRFITFLRQAVDDVSGKAIYVERIKHLCAENSQSLILSYHDLMTSDPLLAVWVSEAPAEVLRVFDQAAMQFLLGLFPQYRAIHREIHVRITDLPISDPLRDIRQVHLNCLIRTSGVITKRSAVLPQLKLVTLTCRACGESLGPTATNTLNPEKSVRRCARCGSQGPFEINTQQTVYGNYQRMLVQEPPGTVPPGRLPRYKEVICTGDLIDAARPGDLVEVTGIYRHSFDASLNLRNGFPVFATVIEANYIRRLDGALTDLDTLTEEEEEQIKALARDPHLSERIAATIAPSIYGHGEVKRALALALFGGQAKEIGEKHRTRGDINVLILGDPGMAKSQFLKFLEKTAPRAVYTTGKGASAVGLTAAVQRDPVSREWTLEGGALVLADQGMCLIDEFDKMNDQDRTSIHEAMEQQSISISKAGIVTTLQARCSVVAAANPIKGRYDPAVSFMENVDLTEPILSRFDVLCVVRDTVDPSVDEQLADFVVRSHMLAHPFGTNMPHASQPEAELPDGRQDGHTSNDEGSQPHSPLSHVSGRLGALRHEPQRDEHASTGNPADISGNNADTAFSRGMRSVSEQRVEPLPQDLFRKYIVYARRRVNPRLSNIDEEKIAQLYIDLRRESLACGGMPIALRHLESIVRLAEAHARMHLRYQVIDEDVNAAIAVMLESFFSSQKYSVMRGLKRTFYKYLAFQRNDSELLLYLLNGLVREYAAAGTANTAAANMSQQPSAEQPTDAMGSQATPTTQPQNAHSMSMPTTVRVDLADFENRARALGITSIERFLSSEAFRAHRFTLDRRHGYILKQL
jgi:DNA replication licensing factor MCM2